MGHLSQTILYRKLHKKIILFRPYPKLCFVKHRGFLSLDTTKSIIQELKRLLILEDSYLGEHVLGVAGVILQDGPSRGVHSLDNKMVQHHLSLGPLQDVLLHTIAGDEPIDVDGLLLSNPVRAAHSLQIVLRVPVGIEYDHGICRGKIYSQTTCTRRQQESEVA